MEVQNKISNRIYSISGLSGFFLFLIIWILLTYTGVIEPFFLPSPISVIKALFEMFSFDQFSLDIWESIFRIVSGFVLALVVSLPLGILIGTNKRIEAFVEPLIAFFRYLPASAFIPLFILWFGIGNLEKMAVVFVGVAPYLTILVADTVANVRKEFIDAGLTLGANDKQIYFKIIIPAALPEIWDSVRFMFGAAWGLIVLVEMVAATSGLGKVIITSQRFLQTDRVLAVILVIGLLGLVSDYLFKFGYWKFFPWSGKRR